VDLKYQLNAIVKNRVEEFKSKLVGELKRNTPVDTGKARNGWTKTKIGVENHVDYISHLNNGTSKQAPRYFVQQAINRLSKS